MSKNQYLYDSYDSELVVIGAPDAQELPERVQRVLRFIEGIPTLSLKDLAFTCAREAHGEREAIALVVTSITDLRDRLRLAQRKLANNAARIRDRSGTYYVRDKLYRKGKTAFLFPGVTSFYPDMLRDLCIAFKQCRSAFDELEEAMQEVEGLSLSLGDYIFPPCIHHRYNPDKLAGKGFAESWVATHAANTAIFRLFTHVGLVPDGVAGFSGGDLAAFDVAGAYGKLTRNKRIQFLREGYLMVNRLVERTDLPECHMLAIADAPRQLLDKLVQQFPGRIALALYYSDKQQTIAIAPEIIEPVSKILRNASIKSMLLPVTRPFNTPWCAKAVPPIQQFLTHWLRHTPQTPIYSCATAALMPTRPRDILSRIADQWTTPIRFQETIKQMYEDGYRIFVELGARGNMTNAVSDTFKRQPHLAVAANRIHRSAITQINHALAMLTAHGVPLELVRLYDQRQCCELDLDRPLLGVAQSDNEMRLPTEPIALNMGSATNKLITSLSGTGADISRRTIPIANGTRRLDFGADLPMLLNAVVLHEEPGTALDLEKTLFLEEYPFLADYALGTSQLSYTMPEMKGLPLLSLLSSLEIMCEAARKLAPRRRVCEVINLRSQRWMGFRRGALKVMVHAERISWPKPHLIAVRVQLRDGSPDSAFTAPVVETTVLLTTAPVEPPTFQPTPLLNARPVNWAGHDIYPDRLFHGEHLRLIKHVDLWSEEGIDFEVEVPRRDSAVLHTRIPLFSIWPMLLDGIVSSFALWRSHEKFMGAISLPFRVRRISFNALTMSEGTRLRGYFRLKSVTPRSHVADIQISDGNGNLLIDIRGWEELCERVPYEYHTFILRPAERYLSRELPPALLGNPSMPVAASVASDIPYDIFERNQEIWLQALAHALLSSQEREEWLENQGTTARRAEWLFGRATAKDAVRRFLLKFHQSRWTAADIPIWADDSGKPHALGAWLQHARTPLDITIAHTRSLVVSAVVANARIGIDVENASRDLTEEFTRGVFTHDELELAAHTGEARVATLSFWCAKEAISKALGTGIRYTPQDLRVTSIDTITGQIEIELHGQWLDAFKRFKGRRNTIHTALHADHVLTTCILPSSLFDDGTPILP